MGTHRIVRRSSLVTLSAERVRASACASRTQVAMPVSATRFATVMLILKLSCFKSFFCAERATRNSICGRECGMGVITGLWSRWSSLIGFSSSMRKPRSAPVISIASSTTLVKSASSWWTELMPLIKSRRMLSLRSSFASWLSEAKSFCEEFPEERSRRSSFGPLSRKNRNIIPLR